MNLIQENLLRDTRFGSITYREDDVLEFPDGLIGFPSDKRFLLVSASDGSSFQWLQSLDSPGLAFLVTDPKQFIAEYAPFRDENGQWVLATVNIPKGKPEEMTINLAGPIVIELESRSGCQIVLDDEAYTTRYRVFANASGETGHVAA